MMATTIINSIRVKPCWIFFIFIQFSPFVTTECILTFQTPIVMLHTRRIAGALPSPDVSDEDFKHNTKACRFILAMFMEDSVGVYPSYYPLERIYGKKEYKVTPFFPRQQGYNEPVAFLIERIEYK